ncbi:MAG: nicotinamide mononucleotide transporter [Bacteroidales bacterium]|nr:nicotinamide mononucleotide transporter [Bacteroidales bacterium]
MMEIFTLVTGVIYIILEIRQKNLMWLVGVLTSVAAMWVFFRQGLYASFALNTYYLVTSFIGLWQWSRDKKKLVSDGDRIHLNRLTAKTVAVSAVVMVLGTFGLVELMQWLNSAGILQENPMSYLDSAATILSAIATWWLVRSYIQQWWLWIVADLMSTILCASQGMWWMTALYAAYTLSAVYGWAHWHRNGKYI